ncbi:MAG TPA: L-rhamnose mutarotase [Chitinophagaceae bacterium]|nr:L-rhamnose mutarotase [Chitinophagaceae bacterium]
MSRIAFKMQLHKGYEEAYKKKHDELLPGLKKLLKDTSIGEYSFFLDEDTNILISITKIKDELSFDKLPVQPVMKRWGPA